MRAPGNLAERLEMVEYFVDSFRSVWSLVYRQKVRSFPKWAEEAVNLRLGQYVVIVTENAKRDKWPLAVVEELEIGDGGLVRNAKVRETKGNAQAKWRNTRYLIPVQFFREVNL